MAGPGVGRASKARQENIGSPISSSLSAIKAEGVYSESDFTVARLQLARKI